MTLKHINKIALVLIISMLCNTVYAQIVDGVIAVVDDKIILKSDLDIQLNQLKEQEFTSEDLTCEVLNQLIIDKIFVVQAGIDSIEVTNDEVDSELNRRIEYFISMFGSSEKLEEYYGKSLFDLKEEFRDDIYQQLLSEKMRGQAFADLDVTPAEVMEFYNAIPADSLPYFNAEVEVGQVVIFAEPTILQKRAAKEKAEKIRQDIIEGSSFGFQALLYSDDPGSASNDGDLGYVKRGQFVPEFEAVAFRLQKDEISDVVETEFGYHIIQMIDRKGDRINTRHILITPDIENENLIVAQEKINEIHQEIINKEITYQEAVSKYSKDEQSKQNGGLMTNPNTGNTFFEMSQLDGNVALALDGMAVGNISEVMDYQSLDGKIGYRIIYLQSESPAHKASINTDYSKIKAVAKQAKQNTEMEKWLAKKAANIYVKVNDAYQHCNLIVN